MNCLAFCANCSEISIFANRGSKYKLYVEVINDLLLAKAEIDTLIIEGSDYYVNYEQVKMFECKIFRLYSSISTLRLNCVSGAERILQSALIPHSKIRKVHINYCSIGIKRGYGVASTIKEYKELSELNLDHNGIKKEGAEKLAIALSVNPSLEGLSLSDNKIEDQGVTALVSSQVIKRCNKLNLHHNKIGKEGVKKLSKELQNNIMIINLDIGGNVIRIEGTKLLAEAISNFRCIEKLNLGGCLIHDEGLKAISHALKNSSSLTKLELFNNKINDAGAIALAEALKNHLDISYLSLRYNKIRDKGAIALGKALKGHLLLTFLDLNANRIKIKLNTHPNS